MKHAGTFYTEADLRLLEELAIRESRTSFWAFRRYLNPQMKIGWWQREIAQELQTFANDLAAGRRPRLCIQAPPQHGKSDQIVEFLAWLAGQNPDLKQIYGSYSERLGVRANLKIQRMLDSVKYRKIFPKTRLPLPGSRGGKITDSNFVRSRELLEFPDSSGYFRNTTVRGSVTGEALDLGAIDDPLKGRGEANSPTIRQSTWEWFTDDFFTRFSENAGLLIILTRWHVDDPVGRLIEVDEGLRLLSYPAIAVEDEKHRKKGEPLFPEHKSLEFLLERKAVLLPDSWESLYQQSPFIRVGGMFPIDKFQMLDRMPPSSEISTSVRYWDKAGTKDGEGAETAGVLMHRLNNGTFVIENVRHGRWAMIEREGAIRSQAERDGFAVRVFVEQEPGSGGKDSAEYTIRNLAGFNVTADRPTGDKALRAEPYASQVQGGNVALVRGEWNAKFIEEHEHFPYGKLKDMVDASSGAFSKVCGDTYDMELLAS